MLTTLLSLLSWRAAAATTLPRAVRQPAAEDDAAPVCGWFDSSHELHRGLQVREHATPDALAQELPLAAWLELQLSGCGVTHAT